MIQQIEHHIELALLDEDIRARSVYLLSNAMMTDLAALLRIGDCSLRLDPPHMCRVCGVLSFVCTPPSSPRIELHITFHHSDCAFNTTDLNRTANRTCHSYDCSHLTLDNRTYDYEYDSSALEENYDEYTDWFTVDDWDYARAVSLVNKPKRESLREWKLNSNPKPPTVALTTVTAYES